MHQSTDDFRHQLEVNLVSVLIVTKAFLPLLGADRSLRGKPGRIINISSTSGKFGFPFVGAYVASKHGLEGFSESLRRELMLYGIDVIIVAPGAVATPIWDKADQMDVSKYDNTEYVESAQRVRETMVRNGRSGLPAEKIGELVWHTLTTPRPRVRYPIAPGNFISRLLPMILPKRVVDRFVARNLGLSKE
jgi:NAD(P)-dependent dehydrogenase (short-subunit alcohol dehydrogenase family)